jgi:hypothetical protein
MRKSIECEKVGNEAMAYPTGDTIVAGEKLGNAIDKDL